MNHNTAQTIMFIAFTIFVMWLMVTFSAWWIVLFFLSSSAWKTDKEIELKIEQLKHKQD